MDDKKRRVIKLEGSFNFRDLGGYPAAAGRRVKWGRLFRSDDLVDLNRADREKIEEIGLRTVIDFRDRAEARISPDRLPASVTERHLIPIEAGRLMGGFSDDRLTRDKAAGIMMSVYRALAGDFQHSFREFFEIVSDRSAAPLLFHCTAGKDRTGMAAALLLSALGVDRETIIDDYMLSKRLLLEKYKPGYDYDEIMAPLYSVEREFILAALDVIDRQCGGMETYLAERLGVDSELLRGMYTDNA